MMNYNTDMIYNMIIATAISALITSFTNGIPNFLNQITYYMKKFYFYFFEKKENEVNIIGIIFKNNYGSKISFPPEYNALMSMLIKKN